MSRQRAKNGPWKHFCAEAAETENRARKQAIQERQPLLEEAIVKLLTFRDDSDNLSENAIPHSTTDYLERVDWSGRAIVKGQTAAAALFSPGR